MWTYRKYRISKIIIFPQDQQSNRPSFYHEYPQDKNSIKRTFYDENTSE